MGYNAYKDTTASIVVTDNIASYLVVGGLIETFTPEVTSYDATADVTFTTTPAIYGYHVIVSFTNDSTSTDIVISTTLGDLLDDNLNYVWLGRGNDPVIVKTENFPHTIDNEQVIMLRDRLGYQGDKVMNVINTNQVRIESDNGRTVIDGDQYRVYDALGNLRVLIGRIP